MNFYPLNPPSAPGYPFAPDVGPHLQRMIADGRWAHYSRRTLERLSTEIHNYTGCDSLLCSSGSIAVELALRACKVQSGDEVILAGYDYPGNFRCIEAVQALAVVVDLVPHTWSIDLNQLREAITSQTKAIIVSHLHGEIQDLLSIREIADRAGIAVIEDACQAMGGRIAGRALGSLGHLGIWSFGGSKLLTAGRGGALLCNDPAFMQRARVASQRSNDAFALSPLQAAVLIPQMELLSEATKQRYVNAKIVAEFLRASDWCSPARLAPADEVALPAFYKLGMFITRDAVDREQFIQRASSRGAEIGPGFRGFASRSSQRCRRLNELKHSREAGIRTMLLHHRHLTASPTELKLWASQLSGIASEND